MVLNKQIKLDNSTSIKLVDNIIMLTCPTDNSKLSLDEFSKRHKLKSFNRKPKENLFHLEVNHTSYVGFYSTTEVVSNKEISALRKDANKHNIGVSAVYCLDEKVLESYFGMIQNIIVLEDNEFSEKYLLEIIKKYQAKINPIKSRYLTSKLYIDLPLNEKIDSIELYLSLVKIGKFSVFFEQVPLISPSCALPNDTLYNHQWNLSQIEWHKNYSGCKQSTVIAILDQGVDLSHPDLNFASNGINLSTMMPDGSPTGTHGTPCAGITSATIDNNEGISGMAGNAKILPLATTNWSDIQIAMGINYAAQFNADVVSMSFGVYDSWNYWNYTVIDPEIIYATNQNLFLCAASGNENQSMNRYPGKHPLVMCVGGSNRDDMRKAQSDGSSEPFWGACYGYESYAGNMTAVSVVAPCLEIPTTTVLGNYTLSFNGTSSATPMVAGLASLIKSIIPDAGNSLVRKIIEKSADKIGGYLYSYNTDFPNSAWTQEVGHGRINVRKAISLSENYCCNNNCCSSGAHENSTAIAFSAIGKSHISKGEDTQIKDFLEFPVNTGGIWNNNQLLVPENGIYYFDWNFVKDAYYHDGTTDDVSLYLTHNGNKATSFSAWSGQGAGKRGTGAASLILNLKAGDIIQLWVHSDGGPNRHVASYGLSGYKLN